MLYFDFSGYGFSKTRCHDIVSWFITNYLPNHTIDISIIHRGLKRENAIGWLEVCDCNWKPREFKIEIQSDLDKEVYSKTLLHELWHLLQHVKGDLRDKRNKRYWKGIDHSNTFYENQPWEKEAIKMEVTLYNKYLTNS